MRKITREDGMVEFSNGKEAFIIQKTLDSICLYYSNKKGKNVLHVSEEDYLLYKNLEHLYDRLFEINEESENKIIEDDIIEIHNWNKHDEEVNKLYIYKNGNEYNMKFDIKDAMYPEVELCLNPLEDHELYPEYDKEFLYFYNNLYNDELEYKKPKTLKLKK